MLNTYIKYCHFDNLHVPYHSIVIFKRLLTCDWYMTHAVNNKFPHRTLFPKIPTYFEITTRQTLFIVRSVLNFCSHWAMRTNIKLEKFETCY